MFYIHSKTACIWLKIQIRQQANYKDSTVNDYIVVNEWDATFYSKLKGVIWCDFNFSFLFGVLQAVHA